MDLKAGWLGYQSAILIAPEPTVQDLSKFLLANSSNLELYVSVPPKDLEYDCGAFGYIYEVEQFIEFYSVWEDRSARPSPCFSPGHRFPSYSNEFCEH